MIQFSYSWLKEFVALDLPADELANHLLMLGFEVCDARSTGPVFTGVVVGEVLKREQHPNADRLSLCEVSDGKERYSVVCGAPNVAAGQRVPFAKIGAKLKGGFKIKKSKIRGVLSQGMICSSAELGLSDEADGILVLPEDAQVGRDYTELLGSGDVVMDVDVKPNRPDCLSHLGLARELAVYFGLPLKAPEVPAFPEDGPAPFPVSVADAAECPRFQGRLFEGVKVGPSPVWLKKKLENLGLPSINNVVDVTNLVLQETGQPMHAYDADLLEGSRILVRDAEDGERLPALNGKEYALTPADLVIADAGRAVGLAGIIGGKGTAVTEKTTRVYLESAHFRAGRIRTGAARLGLRTDASYRFERGTDRIALAQAAARAAGLILELAGGKAGPVEDTAPAPEGPRPVTVNPERLNEMLGTRYPLEKVESVLKRIGAGLTKSASGFEFLPPSYRADLQTQADLAEEVGRHLSYDAIPAKAGPIRLAEPVALPLQEAVDSASDRLCGLGFFEAYDYDFLSAAEMRAFFGREADPAAHPRMHNPISEDWAFLRPSLLPGLLRSARLNFNRGAAGLRFFEHGRVYALAKGSVVETPILAGLLAGPAPSRAHWKRQGTHPDFYEVKAVVDALLGPRARWESPEPGACPGKPEAGSIFHPAVHQRLSLAGKPAGRAGMLHPGLLKRFDLKGREIGYFEIDLGGVVKTAGRGARFTPFSPFPSSSRDISVLVDEAVRYGELARSIEGLKLAELDRIELVDVFSGEGLPEGKKSWTVRLSFSSKERTLKDAEVQKAVDAVLGAAESSCGAALRG